MALCFVKIDPVLPWDDAVDIVLPPEMNKKTIRNTPTHKQVLISDSMTLSAASKRLTKRR